MRPLLITCVLAVLTTCGHAADLTTLYLGPNGQPLAQGKYWQVGVSFVNGEPVLTKKVLFEVGSGPIPPPPVPDVTAQISALIAAVTADPTKAETSKGLAEAYKQILANAGTIKDVATLRRFAEMLIDAILADPKVAKTATWKPFTDGMKTLTATMDLAGVVNAYTIAQGLLGGGPVPPPPPPPPVPIAVSGLHVLMVHDPLVNANLPQSQLNVFTSKEIRDWMAANCELDKAKTPAFRVLRPGQDLSKEVDGVWAQLANQASSAVASPYWVLIDKMHIAVESVPTTVSAALERLKQFKAGG